MKFFATTSTKVDSIPFATNQIIFSTDDRVIYLDGRERVKFDTIITLVYENQRETAFLNGYYFVEETSVFWRLHDSEWTQITNPPDENIIFTDEDALPTVGKEKTLYVTEQDIYQWRDNDYIAMGGNGMTWGSID